MFPSSPYLESLRPCLPPPMFPSSPYLESLRPCLPPPMFPSSRNLGNLGPCLLPQMCPSSRNLGNLRPCLPPPMFPSSPYLESLRPCLLPPMFQRLLLRTFPERRGRPIFCPQHDFLLLFPILALVLALADLFPPLCFAHLSYHQLASRSVPLVFSSGERPRRPRRTWRDARLGA